MSGFRLRLALLLLTLHVALGPSPGQAASLPEEIEAALSKLATYEVGQDRAPVALLSDYISSIASSPDKQSRMEARLLRFISSPATQAGRAHAGNQLTRIATDSAAPALGKLLQRPQTAEIARQVLENIDGPAAGKTLRDSLATTSGALRLGIIGSLGRRKDTEAVKILAPLLNHQDEELAAATITTLGEIGTAESARALLAAKTTATRPGLDLILDALLQSADALAGTDQQALALEIYSTVFESDDGFIRAIALRGLVESAPEQAKSALRKALSSDNDDIRTVAIGLTSEYPAADMTALLAQALPEAPVTAKVQMLSALGQRADRSAGPLLTAATRHEDAQVRSMALEQLGLVGDASTVPLLATAAATRSGEEQASARKSLGRLQGVGVNEAIVDQLDDPDVSVRQECIRAIAARGATNATQALLGAAAAPEQAIRTQALKALADLAGPAQFSDLLQLLLTPDAAGDSDRIERILMSLLRHRDPDNLRMMLAATRRTTDPGLRSSLLTVLGASDHPLARDQLEQSLGHDNAEVRRAAVRGLADWPDPSPLRSLLGVAESDSDPVNRILALRGFIRLVGLKSGRDAPESVQLLKLAMKRAERVDEKQAILGLLPRFPCPEAVQLAETCLADPDLAEAARLAISAIK